MNEQDVSRESKEPSMEGDLSGFPLSELLQHLERTSQSGEVEIHGDIRGQVTLEKGRIISASCSGREGLEALLMLLPSTEGRFVYTRQMPCPAHESSIELGCKETLMLAARLEDEIARRDTHLPGRTANLWVGRRLVPEGLQLDSGLPAEEVLAAVASGKASSLADLEHLVNVAPKTLQLTVAMLVEARCLHLDWARARV